MVMMMKNALENERELTVLMERTVGLFRDFDLSASLTLEQYERTGMCSPSYLSS